MELIKEKQKEVYKMQLYFPYMPSRTLDYDETIAINTVRAKNNENEEEYSRHMNELYGYGSQYDKKENNAYKDRFEYVDVLLCWANNFEQYCI
jgi:hypothetical protein